MATVQESSPLIVDRQVGRWASLANTLRAARTSPTLLIGGAILLIHTIVIIFGPSMARYPATEFHMLHKLEAPSAAFWFGTDQYGRDIFSRIVTGARGTLLLAVVSTGAGILFGVVIGLFSGYFGKTIDEVLMRLMDVMMSFPSLLLAMLILSTLGSNRINVMIGIAVVFTPRVARVVRSVTLGLAQLEFVDAARTRGDSPVYIVFREILPNAWTPIVVEASIRLSYAILLATSLGFLGLGVQPPTPDWGLMINEGRQFMQRAPWMVFFPAAAISTAVIGANLFADGFRRILGVEGGGEL